MHYDLSFTVMPNIVPPDDFIEFAPELLRYFAFQQSNVTQCVHPFSELLRCQMEVPTNIVVLSNRRTEELLYGRVGEDVLPDVVTEPRLAIRFGIYN